ncbi:hypothetical protein [Mycobacterium uberis]|uniref:hypothetical protein n=1 Tax=Mycobacterium uberis TaxID=2162698 RepID=UPI00243673BB|nr:hypothetical protein [Mycobacterium uberis]
MQLAFILDDAIVLLDGDVVGALGRTDQVRSNTARSAVTGAVNWRQQSSSPTGGRAHRKYRRVGGVTAGAQDRGGAWSAIQWSPDARR